MTNTDVILDIAYSSVPFVAGAAVWALKRAANYFHMSALNVDAGVMEWQLNAALGVGIQKVLPDIIAKGWNSPEVHHDILDLAAEYFQSRFKDRTAKIATAAGTNQGLVDAQSVIDTTLAVQDTLAARLPKVMSDLGLLTKVNSDPTLTAALGAVASASAALAATTLPAQTVNAALPPTNQAVSGV